MRRRTLIINKHDLSFIILVFLCVCFLSPALSRTVDDRVIVFITLIYILLELNSYIKCTIKEKRLLALIALYLLMIFVYKFLGLSTASVSYHYGIVKYFIPFICIIPVQKRLTQKQSVFLLIILCATIIITLVQNYRLKLIWGYRYSIQMYKNQGIKEIVSTQYTSAILFLSGAFFVAFLHTKKAGVRIGFMILTLFFIGFNLFVTQKGIILLLTIIMFPLLFFFNSRNRSKGRYFGVAIGIILLSFIALNADAFFELIGNITGSERLASRMNSLSSLLESGSIESIGTDSLTSRLRLIGTSIQTVFKSISNFLIGVGHRTDSNVLVGNHGQLVDEFARYGILGGTLSLVLLIKMLTISRNFAHLDERSIIFNQFVVIAFILFIRSAIGTVIDATIGTVVFIWVPFFFRILNEKEGKQ